MSETVETPEQAEVVEYSRISGLGRWRAPAVAFGMRAAALAGIAAAVSTVGVDALNGIFDGPDGVAAFSWPMGSTCCIEDTV
ncbi:MAG TPA: hypothetical protein VM677_11165 [Actinokineospora sp.]|nr:hypothetical protein [Actinokineospora sp.]